MSPLFPKSSTNIIAITLMVTPISTGGIMEFGERLPTYPPKQCVLSNAILIQWNDVPITSGAMTDVNLGITITEAKNSMALLMQPL